MGNPGYISLTYIPGPETQVSQVVEGHPADISIQERG